MLDTALILIIALNIPAHYFLVKLFYSFNPNGWYNSTWVRYSLLVPPFSIVISGFLVSLGAVLSIFEKNKNENT